jgi:hypothetical protein
VTATARTARAAVRDHYASRQARVALVVLSLALTYGGGAAMFWLHAIYRGEQGPAIANTWHWLLDSTLGFVALTPVLLVLVPLAQRLAAGARRGFDAVIVGGLFAVVTTPGPIVHNRIAGAGTPLARLATNVFGSDPHVLAAHIHPVGHAASGEVLLQLVVGLPLYVLIAYLTTAALRYLAVAQGRPNEMRLVQDADDPASLLLQAA